MKTFICDRQRYRLAIKLTLNDISPALLIRLTAIFGSQHVASSTNSKRHFEWPALRKISRRGMNYGRCVVSVISCDVLFVLSLQNEHFPEFPKPLLQVL